MMSLDKFKIEYKYRRRTRRAVIRVKPGGIIGVSIPYGVKISEIEKWIRTKANWILEKHNMLESSKQSLSFIFSDGSDLPFLGEMITLKMAQNLDADTANTLQLTGQELWLKPSKRTADENGRRALVIQWYKAQALARTTERVRHFAALLNVKPRSISIKNYKSRWGACSANGDLIFNWQIILFSPEMFDCVVAHEVCHLIEMNHSPRFYSWLKRLGFDKSINKKFKNLKNIF